MTYSGAAKAKEARESLGKALGALQQDPEIPEDVMAVAQNIAQSVGALFEAERASTEPDGKACVKNALGTLSQTLALLQDVRGKHRGIEAASEVIAQAMSHLYPLTTMPSRMPPPGAPPRASLPGAVPVPAAAMPPAAVRSAAVAPAAVIPPAAPAPPAAVPVPGPALGGGFAPAPPGAAPAAAAPPAAPMPAAPAAQPLGQTAPRAPTPGEPRAEVEANIGATTESNFYVGFSGEISEGGVFVSTYEVLARGSAVNLLVTLPGGFETRVNGRVRFVRDPLDFNADSEPGMGIAFENLDPNARELVLRFIRKRAPIFYDE